MADPRRHAGFWPFHHPSSDSCHHIRARLLDLQADAELQHGHVVIAEHLALAAEALRECAA
jgi:hypothetical protein